MIIGGGLLASKFLEQSDEFENYVVFASGVSDSLETDPSAYLREIELVSRMIDENPDLIFIYFSCVLADVSNSRYYRHKLEIEKLIEDSSNGYIIFRVPQIVGNGGNKNNLFNYFKNSIINNDNTVIFNSVERSIIDVDDLVEIVKSCKWVYSGTITISNIERINALDLYKKIALALNINPNIIIKESESNNWIVENSDVVNYAIDFLGIEREGYTDKVIQKYIKLW